MPISVSNRPLKNKMYVKCFLKGLFEAEMGIFLCNIIQLLHLNEINNEFNIVVLYSIKPHIDQVQV